jgi:hypothetical protein
MKTIYTVYQLNEKVNKFGNPYIGFTKDLLKRAKTWKIKLKLDYVPELIELHIETDRQRAFDWEQDKRVENRWKREPPLEHLIKITKKANLILQNKEFQSKMGRKNVESGELEKVRSKIRICPYCNKTIKGGNYFKWHGERCRFK